MTEQQQHDRFRNRRKMAWVSFWFIVIVGGGMMLYAISDDQAAERVDKISFLLGTVFGVLTSIVLSYFTASTVTDVSDLRFHNNKTDAQEGK